MQVSYKRDINHNYLILSGNEEIDTESYQVRLLVSNPPQGLLKCTMQTLNNQILFYYEITSRQSVLSVYEHRKMKREDLQLLMGGLVKTMEEMEGHLMSTSYLLLNPEYIYMDLERQKVYFGFYPAQEKDLLVLFRELAEYLLPKIDHTDQTAVILGYSIYRRSMEDTMYIEQIKGELYQESVTPSKVEESLPWEEDETSAQKQVHEEILQTFFEEEEEKDFIHPTISTIAIAIAGLFLFGYFYFVKNTAFSWQIYAVAATILFSMAGISAILYQVKVKKKKDTVLKNKMKRVEQTAQENYSIERVQESRSESFEPDVKPVEGETMILAPSRMDKLPCLMGVYPSSLQPIVLNKEVLMLGKLDSVSDVVLPSPAVSRIHAKIVKDEGYKLYDLNSRNGTYVNHIMLIGNESCQLMDRDEITFGDLTYCFQLNNSTCK